MSPDREAEITQTLNEARVIIEAFKVEYGKIQAENTTLRAERDRLTREVEALRAEIVEEERLQSAAIRSWQHDRNRERERAERAEAETARLTRERDEARAQRDLFVGEIGDMSARVRQLKEALRLAHEVMPCGEVFPEGPPPDCCYIGKALARPAVRRLLEEKEKG